MAKTVFRASKVIRVSGLVLILFVAALVYLLAYGQFTSVRNAAQVQAHRTAHVVATQYSWVLQASAQALRRMEDALRGAPIASGATVRDIGEAVRDLPPDYQYSVYDAQGTLAFSSLENPSIIDISDRSYFRKIRNGMELTISPVVTERLSGEQVIILARRLSKDGVFHGAATIAIPAQSLAEMSAAMGVDKGSTLALIATDGMMIARAPPIAPRDLSQSELFLHLKSTSNGWYQARSPVDGTKRMVGYWALDDWPLIAIVGLNEATVFSNFWKQLRAESLIFLPIALSAGFLSIWLLRVLKTDEVRQAELIRANEKSDHLLREIHHRVKNNLQTVISLIRLEDIPPANKTALMGRINAMTDVHQQMYGSDQFDKVNVQPYLTRLIETISHSYGNKAQVMLKIAAVDLDGDRAMQLGLLTNEIVSNAYKHAFTGRDGGHLAVSFGAIADGMLRLTITDDGPGYDSETTPMNMGTKLISAFTEQLGGTVSADTHGHVAITVDFPITSEIETEAAAP
ncbi:sensor histidine kinase [Phaeovulum sp.]|uniref:sensor histidine kinase n=1 Tax=Phaeovulum sp. TaxID=2934796 RepID=UPI0039E4CDA6